ncbi:glutamate receptor ionotropic, kainate 2-like [Babylonia areolata]|uniref:glutamate receptor ionotropic, kainate 2-like n=1 Tax=Babylonia areolata TaxID=304850 RepID=UPI003FD6683B
MMTTNQLWRRFSAVLLLGLSLLQCARCLPKLLTLGGLFGEGDEHPSVENAFRYAVYRVNHDRKLLQDTRLAYDIQRLPVDDGFRASKRVCLQVEKNTVAIFGPRSSSLSGFVNSLCASLQIPHLESRVDAQEDEVARRTPRSLTVNIHPSPGELSKALTDLVGYYGWQHMLVVYGGKEDLVKVQNVIRGELGRRLEVTLRQVDWRNMRDVLKEVKRRKWRNMLVDLNIDLTGMFLKMTLQEGMIDPYHHYILTSLDLESLDMEDFRHNFVNLTSFRLVDPEAKHVQTVMQDMEIYELQTDLKLLNTTGFLSLPHEVALMYDAVYLLAHALERYDKKSILRPLNASCEFPEEWTSGPSLFAHINQMRYRGLTGDIHLDTGRRLNLKLDILQLKPEGLVKSGTWKYGSGINMTSGTDHTYLAFYNKTLVVTSLKEKPFLMENENPSSKEPFEGFIIDLLNELATMVGFHYRIDLVPDGNYGAELDSGEWDGMVRELLDRKADLAVAPLTINYNREQVIDFTKPFLNLGISILFKMPRREKPGLFSFLNPLAVEIWLYVIGAYLLVSFTIFILARFSPYEWYNPHPCNPDTDVVENTFDLSNSFWFTVGTLMQQGSDINPRAVSTRIVGGIWWFFTLIIISSYTANLAAFLTVERLVAPIETVEDLAKQTDIAYGTRKSGSTFTFFRDSRIDVYQRLYSRMKENPDDMQGSYDEGIERVLEGDYAFFMESTMIDYQVQRNCDLMQVGGLLDSKGYGIGTPMNSPYRDKLSMAILELQENGKIQLMYKKWWKDSGTCVREDEVKGSKASALGVENVGGIFVVLMGGLALAILVAVCEFVWRSRKNAHEDKKSVCAEMAQELRFAVRCIGSKSKKTRLKRRCSKCKKGRGGGGGGGGGGEGSGGMGDPSLHVCEMTHLTATPSAATTTAATASSSYSSGAHDPANGMMIQLRGDIRTASPCASTSRRFEGGGEYSRPRDYAGEYVHVDYSDAEV